MRKSTLAAILAIATATACVPVQECVLACEPGEIQCATQCVAEGECFACDWPFEACPDLSCTPPGMC